MVLLESLGESIVYVREPSKYMLKHQLFFISDPAWYHLVSDAKKLDYILSMHNARGLSDYIRALAALPITNFVDFRPPSAGSWQTPHFRKKRMLTLTHTTVANLVEIALHLDIITAPDPYSRTPALPRNGSSIIAIASTTLELLGINYISPLDPPLPAPYRRYISKYKRSGLRSGKDSGAGRDYDWLR